MSKITEYEAASTFDANDVLLKDGENGTMIISVENAALEFKRLGGIDDDISGITQTVTQAMNTIDSNIAGVETDYIASKDYAIGDLFIVNDVLYKATAAIAEEDVIDTEVNCVIVNLGDELGDIRDILANKANVDGSYSTLTAGNAEQLVGTIFTEDDAAYTFRTAGGSADIGDREYDEIVGGSIVWNQMAPAIDSWESQNSAINVADSVATVTYNGTDNRFFGLTARITVEPNHKLYICADTDASGIATSGYDAFQVQGTVTDHANYFGRMGLDKISGVWNATYGLNTIRLFATGSVFTEADSFTIKNIQIFDLTQMFGSEIADYIYNLEETTEGAGVAWFRKYFPKDYYEYNAGELMHVSDLQSHDMVGFNALTGMVIGAERTHIDAVASRSSIFAMSKDIIPVAQGMTYCISIPNITERTFFYAYSFDEQTKARKLFVNGLSIYPIQKKATFTIPVGVTSIAFHLYRDANHPFTEAELKDICINLSWDGERDGEYEPYVKHSYPLDSSLTLRGIPKLSTDGKLYYDGDHYKSDGTVERRYGIVDLGTLNWTWNATNGWNAPLPGGTKPMTNNNAAMNAICSTMPVVSKAESVIIISAGTNLNTIAATWQGTHLYGSNKNSSPTGILVYELEEPTTETATAYQSPQIVDDFGTEEYVTSSIVPVGHITQYDHNLRAKLEMAPNSPDGDGDYLVRQTGSKNKYVPYTDGGRITALEGKIPAAPSENGTYILKCTITDGTATYAWVAE